MPRSARICIATAYATPLAPLLVAGAGALLADAGRLGGAAMLVLALVIGLTAGAILCVVGTIVAPDAVVRARGRLPWYDYLVLAAGARPLLACGAVGLRDGECRALRVRRALVRYPAR